MEDTLNALEELIAQRAVKGFYRVRVRVPHEVDLDAWLRACEEKDLRCVQRADRVVDVWWDAPSKRFYETDIVGEEPIHDLSHKSDEFTFRIP